MTAKTPQKEQIPCLDGWFTMPPEEPQLIGSRCESCDTYSFPAKNFCPNPDCDRSKPPKKLLLNKRGKLWTFCINHYAPPYPFHKPDPFVPFGVAFVAFPEQINIAGQIASDVDLKTLKIGIDMEVVRETLYVDDQGREVLSWKFRPV